MSVNVDLNLFGEKIEWVECSGVLFQLCMKVEE